MGFSRRELALAAIVGVLLVALAARMIFSELWGTGRQLRQLRDNLERQAGQLQTRLERREKLESQLADFRRRSLPANAEVARSAYGNWLLKIAKDAGFQNTFLEIGEVRSGGTHQNLRFTLKAEASLENVTRFLFAFYSAGYLHKLRTVTLQPRERSSRLEVSMILDALVLNDAESKQQLPDLPARSLRLARIEDYVRALSGRNFFAAYSPPPPRPASPPTPPPVVVPPPPPPRFDASRYAYLTGIVGPPERLEAWIMSRTEGRKIVVREGDRIEVGLLRARVRRLDLRHLELESEGRQWTVFIGQSLRPGGELSAGTGGFFAPPTSGSTQVTPIPSGSSEGAQERSASETAG